MNISLSDNAKVILNENSTFGNIKNSIDELHKSFSGITNLTGKLEKAQSGIIFSEGEALSPISAAGTILDYVKTTKFIRGVKNAIDSQLESHNKKKVKLLYVGPGPYASLIIPLLPLFNENQLVVNLIDFHQESIDAVKKIIAKYELNKYVNQILAMDATKYLNQDQQFDIIIIDTIQKALVTEPQVALTKHFSQFLAGNGTLIPQEVKVSAVLADLQSELSFSPTNRKSFWMNLKRKNAVNRRILLDDIFVLDKNVNEKYFSNSLVNNQITLPKAKVQNKIGRMVNLILLTEITIFDNIILSEEDDTGLTKLYYDQNIKPVNEGTEISFYYQLGSYPRFLMELSD